MIRLRQIEIEGSSDIGFCLEAKVSAVPFDKIVRDVEKAPEQQKAESRDNEFPTLPGQFESVLASYPEEYNDP